MKRTPTGSTATRSTRDRILDAAAEVMRSNGLARTTTKEIARAAQLSEAALYKHFQDKVDLFLGVLGERVPSNLTALLAELPDRAGKQTPTDNLTELAMAAIAFYGETFPIAASLFSEPTLLRAHRAALRERGAGPHEVREAMAHYLAAEQRLGRIAGGADPHAAAALLLGACLQDAFLHNFAGTPVDDSEQRAAALVRTLLNGIAEP